MAKKDTSWGKVAEWYDDHLSAEDTFQRAVILPNLLRVADIQPGTKILDLACGQGFFAREFAKAGARVVAADISPELIEAAKKKSKEQGDDVAYHVAPAEHLTFAKAGEFDVVISVLALQNMENLNAVYKEAARVLREGGRFLMVINHPTFRVLRRSSWGWDERSGVQYRRIDGYLSAAKILVDMHPGAGKKTRTISYHRSLQDFFKALSGAGFAVSKLEEWTSHRMSEHGPRQKAEDTARREIPLFMLLEAGR